MKSQIFTLLFALLINGCGGGSGGGGDGFDGKNFMDGLWSAKSTILQNTCNITFGPAIGQSVNYIMESDNTFEFTMYNQLSDTIIDAEYGFPDRTFGGRGVLNIVCSNGQVSQGEIRLEGVLQDDNHSTFDLSYTVNCGRNVCFTRSSGTMER